MIHSTKAAGTPACQSHFPRVSWSPRAAVALALLCLRLTTLLQSLAADAPAASPPIRLNTVGYVPDCAKRASIATTAICTNFNVVAAKDGRRVFSGKVTKPVLNEDTQEPLYQADFSSVTKPGTYYLEVDGVGRSPTFSIGRDVYVQPFTTLVRSMYLWRCGTAVRGSHGGDVFAHAACHTNDAWLDLATGEHKIQKANGGWHDAGDYNKYVVNAGITVGCMVRAWEDFQPNLAKLGYELPEAGGPLPEFLAEIKWEMDWLLTMQATNGAVHHKLSTTNFGPFILPEKETTARYMTPWSSAATADFVAMTAMAARHFKPYDAPYATRCLEAAKGSRAFLKEHPEDVRADLSAFKTGTYATRDPDDRLWAAAEFWETTGDGEALADFESRARSLGPAVDQDFDWGNVKNLGLFTYLASKRPGRDAALVNEMQGHLVRVADRIVAAAAAHGYARPLGSRYYWGCNGSVARQAMVLHAAFKASPKAEYRETALDAMNFLLGRNSFARSFITGIGDHPPLHPHDRRSGGDSVEAPWPGYLVGGANPRAVDWNDQQADFRTNEIAINWNGALIYAMAACLDGARW